MKPCDLPAKAGSSLSFQSASEYSPIQRAEWKLCDHHHHHRDRHHHRRYISRTFMLFCVCLLFISMFASDSWLLSAMLARNSSPSFSFSRTILAWNIIDIIIIQPWSNSNIQKCNKLSQKCVHLVSPLLATPAFFAQLPLAPIPYCTEPHMPPKLCSFGVGQLTTYIKVYHPKQTIHIIHTPGKPYHHRQLLT